MKKYFGQENFSTRYNVYYAKILLSNPIYFQATSFYNFYMDKDNVLSFNVESEQLL